MLQGAAHQSELSNSIEALEQLHGALKTKITEQTHGMAPERENNWLSLLRKSGFELKLEKEPTYNLYLNVIENLETEYVPHLIHKACVERTVGASQSFKEAHETAFLARQKVTDMFLNISDENLNAKEKYKIAMHHLVSTYFELSDDAFYKSHTNTNLIRNILFSEITSYGIDEGLELQDVLLKLKYQQERQYAKVREYARQYTKDDDYNLYNKNGIKFASTYNQPFNDLEKRANFLEHGMLAEIYAAWMLKHLTKGTAVAVSKASAEEDLRNEGDFFLAEPLDDASDGVDIFAAVDVKTVHGDELQVMIEYPNGKKTGHLNLHRPPSEQMESKAKEAGIPLLVVRIPIERILHNSIGEYSDPKSAAANDASKMRELFEEAFGIIERTE